MPLRSRCVGAVLLALAALFSVGLITSAQASAATSVVPPPAVVPPPGGATLTQGAGGTWSTSAYLDTGALCGDTFDLVTGAPDTANPAKTVSYDGASTPPCATGQAEHLLTDIALTFPPLPGGAIPQTAALVVTPSATALSAGAEPVEFALTIRRQLTGASSLWLPVWFGFGFAVLLVLLVAILGAAGGAGVGARRLGGVRPSFWRATLYAPSTWTFGGSWATNFTALGTAIGGVLTVNGALTGIVPGVDLGRIGLLFIIVGAFALLAPLLFAALNAHFASEEAPPAGGDVGATKRWIMVAAACCTAFGIGAEIGLIGWLLGIDLSVIPLLVHVVIAVATCAVAVLFLYSAVSSILAMPASSVTVTSEAGHPAALLAPAAQLAPPARTSFLL